MRAAARRRRRRAAATMSATFMLTAASGLLAAIWVQEPGLLLGGRWLTEEAQRTTVEVMPISPAAAKTMERRTDAVMERPSGP
jgi:hypothetical protein